MKNMILLFAIAVLLTACKAPESQEAPDAWVKMSPLQCFQNPWEKHWLESNKANFSDERQLLDALSHVDKGKLIQDYYTSLGIGVKDVRIRRTAEQVCAGCNCPTGYTNYLLIKKEYLKNMKKMGHVEIDDSERRIILIPNERYCLTDNDCHWVLSNCCEGGKAMWSCYSADTVPKCPPDVVCNDKKKRVQKCVCVNNICDNSGSL